MEPEQILSAHSLVIRRRLFRYTARCLCGWIGPSVPALGPFSSTVEVQRETRARAFNDHINQVLSDGQEV